MLHVRYLANWTPDTWAERQVATAEGVRLAEALGDDVLSLWSLHWRSAACIEAGDIPGAVAANDESLRLAERLGESTARWLNTLVRGVLAVIAGRLAEAERLAAQAGQLAYESNQPDAISFQAALLGSIRWEQGRAGELIPLAELLSEEDTKLPAMRVLYAVAQLQAGDREEARRLVLAETAEIDRFPYDVTWLPAVTMLAHIAADLGEQDAMTLLYERISPWADHLVYNGLSAWQTAAHHLGRVAGALGHHDEALRHLAAAERTEQAMAAPLWVARTRLERARVLLRRDHGGDRAEAMRTVELVCRTTDALDESLVGRQARELANGVSCSDR